MLQPTFSAYPATQAPLGVQSVAAGSVVPGVQSVIPGADTLGVQGVVPGSIGLQSVLPGYDTLGVQGVVPGSVLPGVQSVAPGTVLPGSVLPGVQSVAPGTVLPGSVLPGVQSVVPGTVLPGAVNPMVTPYVQPIGSRHPIEQNHLGLGLAQGGFAALGGSPYGKISTIAGVTPAAVGTVGAVGTGLVTAPGLVGSPALGSAYQLGGVDPSAYLQHVEILRNACQGAGTDEDAICKVIASTTNQERAIIRRLYTQKYNEDLVTRLQSELSGDFKEAAVGSFMTPTEYDAYCLNSAIKGAGTKEGVLSEIIGSRTPQELAAIKQVYAANYGDVLDNVVASETSGEYQKLLLNLLQCQRSQGLQPDTAGCMNDAAALYQAGEGKWGTDEATFNRVFATRSPADLALINQYYKQHSGKGLLGAIDSEFSGDTKELLDTIVRSNVDPYGYYAGRIHESVAGLGTNDSRLIRNVCARHAVDMPYIKQAYLRDYGKDMLADVQGDTSGHYRQVLSSLIANAR